MEAQISRSAEHSTPLCLHPRRTCAGCPRWQIPPGRLARRCCIDGAITIADHHCHLEARQVDILRTASQGFEAAMLVQAGSDCRR